jgi:LDH2 family malate/lactate/ureidoglycolate dehydrogenase
MNVSKTELTALLKQVFEGLGFHSGEDESAAKMIVWAEMSGLEGVRDLNRSLPHLMKHKSPPLQYVAEDDVHAVIDARNGSALNCADVAVNLAYAKALARGFSSVTLLNCHTRKLLIKAIMDCGRRGMACLMYWRDANDPAIEYVVSIAPGACADGLPRYTVNRVQQQGNIDDADRQSLTIHCATEWQQLEKYQSSFFSQSREQLSVIEPEALRDNYRSALHQGLPIEETLWEHLQELALIVLVESSEQSRMGAGA